MSPTAAGYNLTNGDRSILQQTISRCPVAGLYAGRPLLELRAVEFRKEMFRKRLVEIEFRCIDTKPCSERLDTGASCRELVEPAEAGEGFGFRTAYHQRQTRQNGEMPRIAPILARAVFDIGVVVDGVFKSRLYREYDFGNARRKVASRRELPACTKTGCPCGDRHTCIGPAVV